MHTVNELFVYVDVFILNVIKLQNIFIFFFPFALGDEAPKRQLMRYRCRVKLCTWTPGGGGCVIGVRLS